MDFESVKESIWGSESNRIVDASEWVYIKSMAKSLVLADLMIIGAAAGVAVAAVGIILSTDGHGLPRGHSHGSYVHVHDASTACPRCGGGLTADSGLDVCGNCGFFVESYGS